MQSVLKSLSVLALMGAVTLPVVAEDWPQYRGITGDGKSQENLPAADWKATGPNVAWKVKTPLGFSSFAVSDGRLFTLVAVDGHEVCLALSADSGKELWRAELGENDYGHDGGNSGAPGNRGGDGPRSTPAVEGDKVYVYDSHLVLRCLNATNGEVLWRHDIVAEYAGRNIKWLNATSPVLGDQAVFVSGGGAGQSFLAFNKDDGSLIWKSGDETITHATPTLASVHGTRQLVCFVQSGLVGVEASSGRELWRASFPFSVSTAASPVVSGNQVYCSAGYGVGAALFEIAGQGNAEEIWFKSNELMNHWSTPVAHNGYLYGIFEFKKYGRAPLQCVELATGEIKWSERGFGPGNCILVGDKLVVLSDAGEVAIVAADPSGYRELARADVLEGKCWSTPAYSDGQIYVRSTEEAARIDLAE
ncbi:PQQ-binding-like beta-propeller repeat protein [Roseiconus nitratireducens]|uniref:PQQ-binding-like beta-propeller repeat protein n=1 Tax=Roseiconus nitratireducens TaxID=2605748 RepID=A0A5M6DEG0_9BACT|nr:PQQ-binding-like beta-propeller repeat protein [Roseiconus nitratireducens]KAA5545907.1 PQQ-binding-like beta-propeller repeat protein [Roseiconus nitratireducens]